MSLAALRWHGYRSENRYLVFQCLQHTLGLVAEQWRVLALSHERRNAAQYEGHFNVDEKLMALAPKHAVVLHCLPAYRGYEISEGVMESKRSLVFQEAENRLHFQKGLIAVLMGGM